MATAPLMASTDDGERGRRIAAVDIVRGLAMVLMVLDHARDLAHNAAQQVDPLDLSAPNPDVGAFATRWVTHIVAPTFVLLAGVAAALQRRSGRSRGELARYLLVRGLFLIVLELTVVRVGIWFSVDLSLLAFLQVIWVLGVSMIVLAGATYLPMPALLVIGLAIVIGHNALDTWGPPPSLTTWWILLHAGGAFRLLSVARPDVIVLYPLLPWIGVILLGFVLGRAYGWDPVRRRRWFIGLGLVLIALWLGLRLLNVYGDPVPWEAYPDEPVRTVLSFLNAEKYPPSLIFLLMTLGPTLIALGVLDAADRGRWRVLATLGSVPLFFYLIQWYVVHALAVVAGAVAGQAIDWQFKVPPARYASAPPDAGFPLPVVYVLWLVALAIAYPICRWYAARRRSRRGVLRYL